MNHITSIAAIGRNNELGKGGDLLWKIREDMEFFTTTTNGHPVVMGRKTWESIPAAHRPLAGRTNIIVTRQEGYEAQGAIVCNSLQDALEQAKEAPGAENIFVVGGSELYKEALPFTDKLILTLIEDENPAADTFFPKFDDTFAVTKEGDTMTDSRTGLTYRFTEFGRKPN